MCTNKLAEKCLNKTQKRCFEDHAKKVNPFILRSFLHLFFNATVVQLHEDFFVWFLARFTSRDALKNCEIGKIISKVCFDAKEKKLLEPYLVATILRSYLPYHFEEVNFILLQWRRANSIAVNTLWKVKAHKSQ